MSGDASEVGDSDEVYNAAVGEDRCLEGGFVKEDDGNGALEMFCSYDGKSSFAKLPSQSRCTAAMFCS